MNPLRKSAARGGMHIVCHLPRELPPASELERRAAEHGVGIYSLPSGAAYVTPAYPDRERIVMLGYSSLSERCIREGIARVAAAARGLPPPSGTVALRPACRAGAIVGES